jgi:hypothetical protein
VKKLSQWSAKGLLNVNSDVQLYIAMSISSFVCCK